MICAACRLTRSVDELLAFWPVGDPDRRRYVCRPTTPAPGHMPLGGPCFVAVVGPAANVAIALATAAPVLELVHSAVRPFTPEWGQLMAAAGIRERAA